AGAALQWRRVDQTADTLARLDGCLIGDKMDEGSLMKLSDVEKSVLDLAVDDYTRLADVFVEIKHCMPNDPEETHLRFARRMVSNFIKMGYVRLYYDDEGFEGRRTARQLTKEETREELLKKSNWIPSSTRQPFYVSIGATDLGEKALS
ncbi:MAG: hypothetical protein O7D94_11470, partial [Planctomycetota bacterium]|nr:hypothetical protein [Planctomycetota bacterium]